MSPYIKENKYSRWYFSIIENAKLSNRNKNDGKYYEVHHILPKSIFKEFKNIKKYPWNGILLTLKEHYIVHILLSKMFINNQHNYKMNEAITQFSRKHTLTKAQILFALKFKHKPCSDQRKENISKSRKLTIKITCQYCDKSADPGNFKQFHGENCLHGPNREKVVLLRHKTAMKSYNKGIENNTYTNVQTRMKKLERDPHAHNDIIHICPHCGLRGKGPVMKRHHFDNCPKFSCIVLRT
jgi:hypothetical protein